MGGSITRVSDGHRGAVCVGQNFCGVQHSGCLVTTRSWKGLNLRSNQWTLAARNENNGIWITTAVSGEARLWRVPRHCQNQNQAYSKDWWPGMDHQAEKTFRSCHGCQVSGQVSPPKPMARTKIPVVHGSIAQQTKWGHYQQRRAFWW